MGCQQSHSIDPDMVPRGVARSASTVQRSFFESYEMAEKLGCGSRGTVHAVKRQTDGGSFAVKVVSLRQDSELLKSDARTRGALSEISILRQVGKHVNIVEYVESFVDEGLAFIIMNRCEYTLWQALDSLAEVNESTLSRYLKEMLLGIEACHYANIVHRDVKPDNYMCSGQDLTVRLCDFSLSTRVSSEIACELKGHNGTPPFMAPEMVKNQLYNTKVDVWSVGVIAYGFFFGDYPYRPATRRVSQVVSQTTTASRSEVNTPGTERSGPGTDREGATGVVTAVSSNASKAAKTEAWKAAISIGNAPSFSSTCPDADDVSPLAEGFVRTLLTRHPSHRPSARDALRHYFITPRSFKAGSDVGSLRSASSDVVTSPKVGLSSSLSIWNSASTASRSAPSSSPGPGPHRTTSLKPVLLAARRNGLFGSIRGTVSKETLVDRELATALRAKKRQAHTVSAVSSGSAAEDVQGAKDGLKSEATTEAPFTTTSRISGRQSSEPSAEVLRSSISVYV